MIFIEENIEYIAVKKVIILMWEYLHLKPLSIDNRISFKFFSQLQ